MSDSPKIIINDDYIDLRENVTKEDGCVQKKTTRHSVLNNEGIQQDKELLLKNLVQNYIPSSIGRNQLRKKKIVASHDPRFRKSIEQPENKKCLNSQSELSLVPAKVKVHSMSPSAPHIIRQSPRRRIYEEHLKEPASKPSESTNGITKMDNTSNSKLSKTNKTSSDYSTSPVNYLGNTNIRDPRLLKKYSVLKMPWKRTWTLPVIVKKSATCQENHGDSFDRQTYKYDDGTEIDSLFIPPKQSVYANKGVQSKIMLLLFFVGSTCGLLLVSSLIWIIFGNETIQHLLKPRDVEDGYVKKSLKLVSGGILYILASIVRSIGRVLTVPTHQVFQGPPEHTNRLWPI